MALSHWAPAPTHGDWPGSLGHLLRPPRAGNLAGLPGHFLAPCRPQAGPCASQCHLLHCLVAHTSCGPVEPKATEDPEGPGSVSPPWALRALPSHQVEEDTRTQPAPAPSHPERPGHSCLQHWTPPQPDPGHVQESGPGTPGDPAHLRPLWAGRIAPSWLPPARHAARPSCWGLLGYFLSQGLCTGCSCPLTWPAPPPPALNPHAASPEGPCPPVVSAPSRDFIPLVQCPPCSAWLTSGSGRSLRGPLGTVGGEAVSLAPTPPCREPPTCDDHSCPQCPLGTGLPWVRTSSRNNIQRFPGTSLSPADPGQRR